MRLTNMVTIGAQLGVITLLLKEKKRVLNYAKDV